MSKTICPKFEYASQVLGKRWVSLILHELLTGPKRFNELEHSIELSGKVLAERLKELEEEGFIRREVYPEIPVRIEYSLSPKGQSMKKIFDSIAEWSQEWV